MQRLLAPEVLEAQAFATRHHATQKRKYTNEPYIVHPAALVDLIETIPHDNAMLCAAWMHDVPEDCGLHLLSEIRDRFGDEIWALVEQLTDISKPSDGNRQKRKKIDRMHISRADPRAKTIKLADLIDNSKAILKYDRGFAAVYLPEKRLLLDEALKEGNPLFWKWADEQVNNGLESLNGP